MAAHVVNLQKGTEVVSPAHTVQTQQEEPQGLRKEAQESFGVFLRRRDTWISHCITGKLLRMLIDQPEKMRVSRQAGWENPEEIWRATDKCGIKYFCSQSQKRLYGQGRINIALRCTHYFNYLDRVGSVDVTASVT